MKNVDDVGEIGLIRRLTRKAGRGRGVVAGIGDDCAVVRPRGGTDDWLLTTDAVIDGVHFDAAARAEEIGHKAAGRVLSDLAAMGGEPLYALVDLVAPAATPLRTLDGIYRGLNRLLAAHGAALIGGDTARGPTLELHVFGVGRVPRGTAVRRAGARPGQVLFVTGALGGSRRGRHLRFAPRVAEGRWLRAGGWASAMIDLSDGLATDLRHLLKESGVGARLEAKAIPIAAEARRMADGGLPLEHALGDGEDFELLFTVPRRRAAAFVRAWRQRFRTPCIAIGFTTRTAGLVLVGPGGRARRYEGRAFEHFRTASARQS
jgi:thiamine-monophosphate kinase